MVCRNDGQYVAVWWDDNYVYGLVAEPTEYQRQLIDAVNRLPDICRKVVILFAFEGIQRDEIAALMTTSLAAIRSLVYRSGLLLQERLANKEKQCPQNYKPMRLFGDWPYMEYANLVKLREKVILLD